METSGLSLRTLENTAWKSLICPVVYFYRQGNPQGFFHCSLKESPSWGQKQNTYEWSSWVKNVSGKIPTMAFWEGHLGGEVREQGDNFSLYTSYSFLMFEYMKGLFIF